MSEAEKEIVLERMYCLRVGGHTLALEESEARQLYDLLHAEFVPIAKPQLVGDLGPATPDVWRAFLPCPAGPRLIFDIPVAKTEPDTGPTLQDDIDNAIARADAAVIHDISREDVTDADSPHMGESSPHKQVDSPHSEPPAPDQSWQDRLRELWSRYIDLEPSVAMKRLLTAAHGSKHAELKAMSSQELRGALREMGFDMPEPASHAERAAMARAAKLARNRERLEPPKVEAPAPAAEPIESTRAPMPLHGHPLEVSIQLIHILARAGRCRFPDGAPEVAARIGDLGPGNRLGSMPMTEVEEWERAYRKWLDAYSEMPPFKQRDVDASLLTEWKMLAA